MKRNSHQLFLLYRLGGITALLAVFVFRRNWSAELDIFKGFGIFTIPETLPTRAKEWFALLRADPFVGLSLLGLFDVVEYALVGLIFLAVCAALWQTNRSAMLLSAFCGFVGIGIYWASNQALGLFALSRQSTASGVDHTAIEFAGDALLALHNHGSGIMLGPLLVLVAGLTISIAMLRSAVFSKATAVSGILANGIYLLYYPALAFGPMISAIPPALAAPFRMIWYLLIARHLFQLAQR